MPRHTSSRRHSCLRVKLRGLGILETRGHAFTNLPLPPVQYVRRSDLHDELNGVLTFQERQRVITVFGRGGIGKTSLTLSVLNGLTYHGPYAAISGLARAISTCFRTSLYP